MSRFFDSEATSITLQTLDLSTSKILLYSANTPFGTVT